VGKKYSLGLGFSGRRKVMENEGGKEKIYIFFLASHGWRGRELTDFAC